MQKRILVIKLSAFGDMCLALGLFEKIRAYHAGAHITLVTTPPYQGLGTDCGAFDEVTTISRWPVLPLGPWLSWRKRVHTEPYDMVYDLQSNDRTRILRRLSPPLMRRHWLDKRKPLPLPHADMLDITPYAAQLPENLDWLYSKAQDFSFIPQPYVLLAPGSAPQHPAKRWPAAHYAQLAQRMAAAGVTPVLLGTRAEADVTNQIAAATPAAINLTDKTTIADMGALARAAAAAVGNDTGPMHLVSICACPIVSLFSGASNPAQSAPRGPVVHVLRRENLADLDVDTVWAELEKILS